MKPATSLPQADAILSREEPDAPVVPWTLDDQSADPATLRFALANTVERHV